MASSGATQTLDSVNVIAEGMWRRLRFSGVSVWWLTSGANQGGG